MNKVVFTYIEKYFYEKDSILDINIFIDKNMCTEKDGKVKFNITGIYIIKSKVYVFFPFGYKTNIENKDILLLLDLFAVLYKEEKINPDECKDIKIRSEGNGRLISVAYEIIKDYEENGYIQIEHIVEGINIGGKINWKKTMKMKNSIFNEDGMPIYTNFISIHGAVNQNSLLRSLHLYVINKSIAMFGFLLGINCEYTEDDIEIPVEKNYAIYFLKKEKHRTFNSRILKVIDLIIKFIESTEEESNKDIISGVSTKTFYAVWELMCKNVFKDEYNKYSAFIPRPYWKDDNENMYYTQQIPDIIYKNEKTLYILDAKYYNFLKNKPGWPDLVKQYFYQMSLNQVINDISCTYNIMIFPGNINEVVKFKALSRVEQAPVFGEVLGIELDMQSVLNDFIYGCNRDYRERIDQCLNSDFI